MRVAFRADASLDIGHGHVMRCLTLAHALREHGASCLFICRVLPGHLIDRIRQEGFDVIELPAPEDFAAGKGYAGWLGAAPTEDAVQTLAALPDCVDWLVVDHYALDAQWEGHLRATCKRLLVIDDLADRAHDCDLLLDQNPGRSRADYAAWVPSDCTVLAGPAHALLRSEFAARRRSVRSSTRTQLKTLMISMGGVDRDNASTRILDALNQVHLPAGLDIVVVLGAAAPWRESVQQAAARMRWPTRVLIDVRDMADLMAASDLAIGAGGGSALERCCLGLPSIIVPVAENQHAGACALAIAGAAILASIGGTGDQALRMALTKLMAGDALTRMSAKATAVTDGEGATQLAARMLAPPLPRLRAMQESDLDRVLGWRNAPGIRRWMLTTREIGAAEHAAWFRRCSADPDRQLLIAEDANGAFGFVQFSGLGDASQAEWGFYVAPDAACGSGRLLGQLALAHAFGRLRLPRLIGRTLNDNAASIAFHLKLGFRPLSCLPDNTTPMMRAFELRQEDWDASAGATA